MLIILSNRRRMHSKKYFYSEHNLVIEDGQLFVMRNGQRSVIAQMSGPRFVADGEYFESLEIDMQAGSELAE